MTEKERLLGLDQPEHMRVDLWNKGSIRKCRSFGLALCRELTHYFADPRSAEALAAVERWIKNDDRSALELARRLADNAWRRVILSEYQQGLSPEASNLVTAAHCVLLLATLRFPRPSLNELVENVQKVVGGAVEDSSHRAKQAELLGEVFQHHYIPVSLDRRWLTSTVVELAQTIYDGSVYERMPILADALMDAGCDSEEIIAHCQGPGPHLLGCWVLDLLLGKK